MFQNKETASVTEPVTVPESTSLRASEVDSTLTSPESGKENSAKDLQEHQKPEEKKKMVCYLCFL